MPNLIKQIPDTMRKLKISEEIMSQFEFPKTGEAEEVMTLIRQMDKLLSEEQCLAVMEQQGCHKTGNAPAEHNAFSKKYADKTLQEKVTLLNAAQMLYKAPCRLNDDGTLSVYWGNDNMLKRECPCGFTSKLPEDAEIPRTFCGCCGGHIKSNYQKSLGVKLRLKEIVSSSSSSLGKKRCEFLFEIVS